jgi:hypothetical protein
MLRSTCLLGLSLAWFVAVAAACSSSDTSMGSDSGTDGTTGSSSSSGGSGSSSGSDGSSSGSSQKCDGSVMVPAAGTDGAAPASCLQCLTSNCSSQIAECGPDCVCQPALTCLLQMGKLGFNNAYTICPNALAAISNGNPPLMDFSNCSATKCNCQCSATSCASSDAGGQ